MILKKLRHRILLVFLAVFLCGTVKEIYADEAYEFIDRDIHEILYALSLYTGFSISADDTVSGKADFRCTGENFDDSFEAFLLQSRLYVEKSGNRWTVSRVRIQKNNDLYSLDAFDVSPVQLFEKIAIATGFCVTYDSLPGVKVSLHTGFCKSEEILKRITGLCMGFSIEKEQEKSFHVTRNTSAQAQGAGSGKALFALNDGKWLVDVQNTPLSVAAEKFFTEAGKEFCFLLSNEQKIMRASFKSDDFDEALSLLCVQAGAEYVVREGVYFLKASKNRNLFAQAGKKWRKHELNFLRNTDCISLLCKRFPEIECLPVSEESFLFLCDDDEFSSINAFVSEIDTRNDSRIINLKYIRTEDFMAHLPPFLEKGAISDTGQGDSFFFSGSEAAYDRLIDELSVLDRPVSRVRYDLLIMQYQSTKDAEWNPRFKAGRVKLGDMTEGAVQLGSVLNLNLDVIGAFGLHFAGELQTAISESRAKVFADTTLSGVSGKPINFQNTNTYRYRDNNLDPETGEPIYSGITKEIISGLKLEVTGTVTGDGMITSRITASVSRQGTDLSTTTGNPPPTSEKVITTEVRAKSGEPVVLSGLVQEESNENVSRIPLISRIPLLGRLFKAEEKSAEKTELVIYLLPSAEIFGLQEKNEQRKSLFKKQLSQTAELAVKKLSENGANK